MIFKAGWQPSLDHLNHRVSYHEPLFIVVIMAIASTRPILNLAEQCLKLVARIGGGPAAWWFAILTLGPLLGSLITEPAAMTISAPVLGRLSEVLLMLGATESSPRSTTTRQAPLSQRSCPG